VIVEGEPALVDDEQGGPPIEAVFDAVEEIGEDSGRGAPADQTLGFESLNLGLAETLALRIEQSSPGTAHGIGLQGLLERIRLQKDRKARDRPLRHGRGGERGQRRPQMFLEVPG